MYIPPHFEEKDMAAAEALVREFGFATLVSVVDGRPWATHIPLQLVVTGDQWRLYGHIARANTQWRTLAGQPEVLAVFMGPHSYISPSWYDQANVPTWNYQAVHLYGRATIIEGEQLEEMLRQLMSRYESTHASQPLSYDELPRTLLDKDLHGLIGLEIQVDKIEAVSKLSQNRNEASYHNIIDHLRGMKAYDASRIADEMDKRKNRKP